MINNIRLKISALFLAILLWLYASGVGAPNILSWGSPSEEPMIITVPLKARNLASSLTIPTLPQTVKIHCYSNDSSEKLSTQLEAFIDCEDLEVGQYWLNILVDLPKDFELTLVNPSMLLVSFEESALDCN